MGNSSNRNKQRASREYFDRKRSGRPDYDVFALEMFSTVASRSDIRADAFVVPKLHLRIYGDCPRSVYRLLNTYKFSRDMSSNKSSNISSNRSLSNSSTYFTLRGVLDRHGIELNLGFYPYVVQSSAGIDTNSAGLHFIVYDADSRASFQIAESVLAHLSRHSGCHYGDVKYMTLVGVNVGKKSRVTTREGRELADKYIAGFCEVSPHFGDEEVGESIESGIREYYDDQLRNIENKRQQVYDYVEEQRRRADVYNMVLETRSG